MPSGMTGFGRAASAHELGSVTVELKSVNNRFLKLSVRLPDAFAELEPELDALVRKRAARGSVNLSIQFDRKQAEFSFQLNEPLIRDWLKRLAGLAVDIGAPEPGLADVLGMHGVVLEESRPLNPDDSLLKLVMQVAGKALDAMVEMRRREGAALAQDLKARVERVESLSAQASTRAPVVVLEYREKLRARLDKLLADSGATIEEAVLAREAALFADRCDITEETTRLAHHCRQFLQGLAGDGEVGRRLDFIAQEMLRETNTMGSKANDAALATLAVEMKSEIEKIKEQVQNLE